MNHNEIASADFLTNLLSLETIDLSYNESTQTSVEFFKNMSNLKSLNIAYNKFAIIDLTFLKPTQKLSLLDISNNQLSGRFQLNVDALALATLNIANNNYTSVQQNLKKWAPSLVSIDLNGNYFDCDELSSMILFMHFDHIIPIVGNEDSIGSNDNVKGIKCHHQTATSNSEIITKKVHNGTNYNVFRNEITNSIDEKLLKLELRLIEIIKNVTVT